MPQTRTAQQNTKTNAFENELARWKFVDHFIKKPHLTADYLITSTAPTLAQMALILAANPDWEVLGDGATTALVTHATGGGLKLQTDTTSEDQTYVTNHKIKTNTFVTGIDLATQDQVAYFAKIMTGPAITLQTIFHSLRLTMPAAAFDITTDADRIEIYYQASTSANWQCGYSVAGTDYTLDSGVKVALSTSYTLGVFIDASRMPHFSIDGDEVAVGTNAMTTNIDLLPFTGIETNTGAAKYMFLRNVALSKDHGADTTT